MKMKRVHSGWLAVAAAWLMAGTAWAVTNGDVTWSGGGGAGNPGWDQDVNWLGGAAPTNPTAATVSFVTNGQDVVSVMETDRQVANLDAGSGSYATTHTIDLGAKTLTVTNRFRVISGSTSLRNTLNVTNGTVRIGTATTPGSLTVTAVGTLCFQPGSRLDPTNLHTLTLGANAYGSTYLDLRGAQIVGGTLRARRLYMNGTGWYANQMLVDGATSMTGIEVTEIFEMGRGDLTQNTPQYIGNPSDTFTYDGASFGKLPAGISLTFGTSATARASVHLVENGGYGFKNRAAIRAAGGGGVFRAYLSSMKIGSVTAGAQQPRALLDVAAMDSCTLDVLDLQIAPGRTGAASTDNEQGELDLPQGTATVATVVIGATDGLGYGRLVLSNTLFTVTNAFTLNKTAQVTIRMGGTPNGLDVQKGFTDGGGTVTVQFVSAPAVGTNWAFGIKGDARMAMNAMVGAGRLSSTGSYPGKKAGVLYDTAADYTYYAMADSNAFVTLPIANAYDERTCELAAGNPVTIGTNDINNGSYDPDGRSLTLTISTNGGAESATLAFAAVGDYPVTLKVTAGSDYATDTCTVHVVTVNPGVTNALTWKGAASTPLMPGRREWMWSGNWLEGAPPTNPTAATLYFKSDGQNVTGKVETSRTVGGIEAGISLGGFTSTHTIDLGGNTLTVAGRLRVVSGSSWAYRNTLNFTNGTVQVGTPSTAGYIDVLEPDLLAFLPGTLLDTCYLDTLTISFGAYAASLLDLRGAGIVGGTLRMRRLTMSGWGGPGSLIYMDGATSMTGIEVTESFEMVKADQAHSAPPYIGNPADPFVYDGATFGKLPAGIGLTVGTSAAARASMFVAEDSGDAGRVFAVIKASSGGVFRAYLSSLKIGSRSGTGECQPRGLLDVAAMDSCALDVLDLQIAPGRTNALSTDNEQGELDLPPGTATVGTATLGATNGVGYGRLVLSNTMFTVTNAITINRTGRMTVNVGSQSCGLVISNAADTALSMDTATNNSGALRIVFNAKPSASPFYGLWWAGDHVAALEALQADGKLVIDDTALGKPAAIVRYKTGATYIGLPPPAGTVILMR